MHNSDPKDLGDVSDLLREASLRLRFALSSMGKIRSSGADAEDFDGYALVCLEEIIEDVAGTLAGAAQHIRKQEVS